MVDYYNLLKDFRWIKKRNIIFKRDGRRCTVCGSKKNLQVHHTYYIDGSLPWNYPDYSLMTVCRDCHKTYHEYHELIILPAFARKKHKKSGSQRRKKKQHPPNEPRKSDKLKARTTLNHPTYRKCINGTWFDFEVRY